MKNKSFLICWMLLLSSSTFSQSHLIQVRPAGNRLWGYANLKGEIVIQPQYERCYEFSKNGYAPIYDRAAKQYFFIDANGKRLVTEISSFKLIDGFGFDLKGFEDGLVPVKVGGNWGYMNTAGKMIIQPKYDDVTDFNGGFVPVKRGTNYLILNTNGDETAVEVTGILDIKHFSEGLAPYRAADKKFGFIDSKGKIAIAAQFESVGYFTEGLAWAKTADKMLGYIDKSGVWVIKPQFDVGKNFEKESGLARVKTGDKWAYVNKGGELSQLKGTDIFEDFSNGLARGRRGDQFGFLNSTGEWAIEPQFSGARDFKNGYASVKRGELWGVIDTSGKWVIQPQFDGIKDMEIVK